MSGLQLLTKITQFEDWLCDKIFLSQEFEALWLKINTLWYYLMSIFWKCATTEITPGFTFFFFPILSNKL